MRRKGKRLKESKKMDRKGSKIAKPEDEVDVGPLKRERNRLLAVTMRMMLAHQKRKKVHVCRKNKLHSQSDLECATHIKLDCEEQVDIQRFED
ncbi:hypothetical protein RND71_042488 [Anisodus tanguticus]|uniref:Uncharacterized protein n=1 Tax=Anisodus tanguticus TaxID=243964 RepID=A0AAE1QQS6_9SOLA|nr:hypothetical protein RND71_042488 [Anisodus tanguticus]